MMNLKHIWLSDLSPGMQVQGTYLGQDIKLLKTRTEKDYLSLTLTDQSGQISAKMWDVDPSAPEVQNILGSSILKVRMSTEDYQGKIQARLEGFDKVNQPDQSTLDRLIPTAPIDPQAAYDRIMALVADFENQDIKDVVEKVWSDHKNLILIAPASQKVHHAQRGGYLYHIVRMTKQAQALAEVYSDLLNRDLLIAGVLLHDIGKLYEYRLDSYGLVDAYSRGGNLLGHITIGANMVANVCSQLNTSDETKTLLMHLILAHHNNPEWGSPVRPAIPEALALHHIDALDAHLTVFEEKLPAIEAGCFSEPEFFLNRTKIYKRED